MEKFVKITFEVRCKWIGFPPEYRIYVNDELFVDREYRWDKRFYLKEILQIKAEPGIYKIRIEQLEPKTGEFEFTEPVVDYGPAKILNNNEFEIL